MPANISIQMSKSGEPRMQCEIVSHTQVAPLLPGNSPRLESYKYDVYVRTVFTANPGWEVYYQRPEPEAATVGDGGTFLDLTLIRPSVACRERCLAGPCAALRIKEIKRKDRRRGPD
ncbi:hypothetical protein RRG08_022858 [Elysia crispata]|uniref:Uncharacterized protein n=1 Tax=Elysia crispata TaxID=231223 RepID=A0AAE1D8E5_9GAST|nr:hypothetical protein RRG08_022858 [Elysia crispata]